MKVCVDEVSLDTHALDNILSFIQIVYSISAHSYKYQYIIHAFTYSRTHASRCHCCRHQSASNRCMHSRTWPNPCCRRMRAAAAHRASAAVPGATACWFWYQAPCPTPSPDMIPRPRPRLRCKCCLRRRRFLSRNGQARPRRWMAQWRARRSHVRGASPQRRGHTLQWIRAHNVQPPR